MEPSIGHELRRVELRLFNDAAAPHLFALPASGATVQLFRRTFATAVVQVEELETVTVPVTDASGFAFGEGVRALGGPDREFQVRSVGTSSLELDDLGTSNFSLAVGERLRLHDLQGRAIATLIDGPLDAGQHTRRGRLRDVAGSELAGGVYFARIEVAGRVLSPRIVVAH